MHSHLVAVEVSVKGSTYQRVQLNSLTLNQLGLKSLDTQTVQGRCTVKQHRVLTNNLSQYVPNLGVRTLHHTLGGLNVLSPLLLNQALHNEGLEQLQGHLAGQTTLVQLELGATDDYRTARVVHTLTQQVLTETTLLTLEHVRQALERAVTDAGNRAATATIVEQRVHSFLQHTLFVVNHDLGGV